MKRQSKFRAKNDVIGTWEFGSMITDNTGRNYIWKQKDVERDGHHIVNTNDDPMTYNQQSFGEFVNRKDCNDKDIYELDIVKILPDNFLSIDDFFIGVVVMINGNFRILTKAEHPYNSTYYLDFEDIGYHGNIEVIGNFIDNQHLIDELIITEVNKKYI